MLSSLLPMIELLFPTAPTIPALGFDCTDPVLVAIGGLAIGGWLPSIAGPPVPMVSCPLLFTMDVIGRFVLDGGKVGGAPTPALLGDIVGVEA